VGLLFIGKMITTTASEVLNRIIYHLT